MEANNLNQIVSKSSNIVSDWVSQIVGHYDMLFINKNGRKYVTLDKKTAIVKLIYFFHFIKLMKKCV